MIYYKVTQSFKAKLRTSRWHSFFHIGEYYTLGELQKFNPEYLIKGGYIEPEEVKQSDLIFNLENGRRHKRSKLIQIPYLNPKERKESINRLKKPRAKALGDKAVTIEPRLHFPGDETKVIPFAEVKENMPCFSCEDDELIGIILFKGTMEEILKSKYHYFMLEIAGQIEEITGQIEGIVNESEGDYNWVVVQETTGDPQDDINIYNYDCDPSGVYSIK